MRSCSAKPFTHIHRPLENVVIVPENINTVFYASIDQFVLFYKLLKTLYYIRSPTAR